MVAPVKQIAARKPAPAWHKLFLNLLPAIVAHARVVFRHLKGDNQDDMIQEVIANSYVACWRLAELNKLDLAYPSVLARFAVAQALEGRRVGSELNVRDISSPYAQKVKDFRLDRLDRYDAQEECWEEILVPDRTCTPAELAASRIDFPAWLDTLSKRDRRIALKLAGGETTDRTARKFGVSPGRISQLRRQLYVAWLRFHGEAEPPQAVVMPA
jgi:hypothetical protein